MATSAITGEMINVLLECREGDKVTERWYSKPEYEELKAKSRG